MPHRIAAGAYDNRSADAKMSKQHLPEFFINTFSVCIKGCFHIFKGKPLKPWTDCPVDIKRNKRRVQMSHLMSRFFCKWVPVSGGTCGRIRNASRCNDYLVRLHLSPAIYFNTPDAAILRQNLSHLRIQLNRHLSFAKFSLHGSDHVWRFVRHRKHTVPPLYFHRTSPLLHPFHHLFIGERIKCTV